MSMDRKTAIETIRRNWRTLYPHDSNNGIICPLCGSGSGSNGTGITSDTKHNRPHYLRCWKCDFKGDVLDLIQQEKGISFVDALNYAADKLRIESPPQTHRNAAVEDFKPEDDKKPTAEAQAQEGGKEAQIDYTEYYRQCVARLNDPAAATYLQARGISLETAAAHFIGYDPHWRSPAALRNGKNPPESPRIIMPCNKWQYEARDIRPDADKKYCKMNEGGKGLFNLRAMYGDAETVFVVEGIFDALSIIEAGAAAVALNSTSNADKLIEQLEKQPTKATIALALDADEAGQRATNKLKEGLQRLNIGFVYANICGNFKDPNEHLTGDKDGFISAIMNTNTDRPDNVATYLDGLMTKDIQSFADARDRKTGFARLDELADGLHCGLYIVAAISSLGKTTFCSQLADNIAAAGNDVIFFSMEQSRLEMVSKSIARRTAQRDIKATGGKPEFATAVSSLSIRRGYLPETVLTAADEYRDEIGDCLSIVEGNFACDITFIGNYVRNYVTRTGSKPTVFIDYLQVLQPSADELKRQQRREVIDNAVTELKRLSRELGITIFAISSVNRSNYLTPIDFESLKESGGIEFTADVIWGLQLACLNDPIFDKKEDIKAKREKVREAKAEEPRKIELLCLKNRFGVANFSCFFDYYPKYDLFREGIAPTEFSSSAPMQQRRAGQTYKKGAR